MDDADYASLREEQERAYRLAAVSETQLNPAGGTLQCVECGVEIEVERRRVLPATRTCFPCQQWRELQQSRYRAGAAPSLAGAVKTAVA